MNASAQIKLTSRFTAPAPLDTIEWEELPSLPVSAVRGASNHERSGPVWNPTMPASLEQLVPSSPFREPMRGLVTREVNDPDVFRHFFG
jgi:hypothetical protein